MYINFYYSRTYEFRFKNDVTHVFSTICFVADSFYLLYFYLFTHTGFQHDFNITCYSFSLPVIWKVPLVEQEEPGVNSCVVIWIRVAKSLAFCVEFWHLIFVFVSFLGPLKSLSFWYIETLLCSILYFPVYNVLKIKTYSWMVHQLNFVLTLYYYLDIWCINWNHHSSYGSDLINPYVS